MKNILLLADLSREEAYLQKIALDLCSRLRCNLILLNVYNDVPYVPALSARAYEAKWYSGLYDAERKRLNLLAVEIGQASRSMPPGVYHPEVSSVMSGGDLGHNIKQSTSTDHVELVIMGKGKSGALAHLLFGNAVTSVVKNSRSPVLIIPESANPLKENAKVIFATDFNKNDLAACAYLSLIGSMLNFTTEVVHVKKVRGIRPSEIGREHEFVDRLKALESPTLSYRHLMGQEVLGLLGQWTEIIGADWLALSEHHRPFLISMFKTNTLNGAISAQMKPLLIFPEHFAQREYFSVSID